MHIWCLLFYWPHGEIMAASGAPELSWTGFFHGYGSPVHPTGAPGTSENIYFEAPGVRRVHCIFLPFARPRGTLLIITIQDPRIIYGICWSMDTHSRMKNILPFFAAAALVCGCLPASAADTAGGTGREDDAAMTRNRSRESPNIDGKILYGNFHSVDSTVSIAQNAGDVAYQLGSDLKRSSDYGYRNSGFSEYETGFTIKADFTDNWKFMPEMNVRNEYHGMFASPLYSREEKDRVIFSLKNEYRSSPYRFDFNFSFGQYIHRLVETTEDQVGRSGFNRVNGEAVWEYIWSSSNRLGVRHRFSRYFYDSGSEVKPGDDSHVENEAYLNFKIMEYIQIGLGGIVDWNRDLQDNRGWFTSGRVNVSTIGLRSSSLELSYVYDMESFQPEILFYDQKFMNPDYTLPPQKVHKVDLRGDLDLKLDGNDKNPLRLLTLRGKGSYEKNDNFYNFMPLQGNVLGAESLPVVIYTFKGDFITDLRILGKSLKLAMNYEYRFYRAEKNITYRPREIIGGQINYKNNGLEIEWDNRFTDEVYINPEPQDRRKLDRALIGSIIMQLRMVESFFLYAKVNNLYDLRYGLREGYYEPGRTYLGGLRIMI